MEFKLGLMEPVMKGTGKTIKLMVKESSGMLMEMFLKENGLKTKLMVTVCIRT